MAAGAAVGAIFITIITAGIVTFIFNLIPQILTMIYIVGIIYIVYKGIVTIKAEIKIPAKMPKSLDKIGNKIPRNTVSSNNGARIVVVKNKRKK